MRLFLRLLGYVRPYWRRLLAALACMAVFAVVSTVSLGMILPFVNMLFEPDALMEETGGGSAGGLAAADGEGGLAAADAEGGPATTDAGGARSAVVGNAGPSDPLSAVTGGGAAPIEGFKETVRVRVLAFFASDSPDKAIGKICLVLLVVFLIKNLFGYLQTFLMITVEQGVIRDIRNVLFSHLSVLSLSFFHGKRTGQLISRITNDVGLVKRALVATFANLFRESLLVVFYLGISFWISWRLALITFVVMPPFFLLVARIGRRLRKRSARIQERMADITSTLQESISGIRVVKAFGMEEYEQKRFFKNTWDFFRATIRMELLGALAAPLVEYLGVIGIVLVLWYGARQVLLEGGIGPDWFLIFLASTLSTMQPLRKISRANNELQVGLAAAKRIFDVVDTPSSIVSRPGAQVVAGFDDRVRYEDVSFRYDTGDDVLRSIDLEIKRGEIVAIVGPSGAGKSTLLDLLPRFYDPTAGRITIDGRDLKDVDLASLRRLMGIVTQETILFNDTVRNNIAYGLEGAGIEEIVAAAHAANAHRFIEGMPNGYDTVIGERGAMVSGGERQRIAIARAILKNPPVLIFDEATSSLDTESERLVQEAIEHLLSGRTVLLIAHRLSTIRNADRIVVMDGGRVRETGTHQELMDSGGLYRHLYDMQFRDEPIGPRSRAG